ncbi:hypothetical protein AAP_00170 [Ascosphaera apis ARSEF 7405]|uniref:Uncharacterized protein n=1 Tax=Ascosphaera apis ARSEF 7405 TaxID=392613 RepID=A0A168DMJ3_9EURO|nr:hypothetical protein AAP_00170 [Ascosphaera apis ARSEF 7405]
MKFLALATITSLLSFAAAAPVPASNDTVPADFIFELAGLRGHKPDIHKYIPLDLNGDDLAYPDSSDSKTYATVKPWGAGELLGGEIGGKLNGLQGYIAKTSEDKIYDFKFGELPSDTDGIFSKGFLVGEDHPDGGVVGVPQLFFALDSKGENVGAFVIKSDSPAPHPIKWFNDVAKNIPDGYEQVWILRPVAN